jgi:hypothetical protein
MGNRTLSADFTLPPQGGIDKWIVDRENLLKGGPTRVESVTVDRIDHGSLLESRGGEIKGNDTIPIGTTLYPLRIHFMCALRAVEGYAPGVSPVTIDQYFYQDPFGEWVSFTAKYENGEFVQTGPIPSRSAHSGVSQYDGPSAAERATREAILKSMKEYSASPPVRTPNVAAPLPDTTPTQTDASPSGLLIRSPRPPYPAEALQSRLSGIVHVRMTVQAGNIVAAEACGPPILASAAARWVRSNWKFSSSTNGTFTLPISFSTH